MPRHPPYALSILTLTSSLLLSKNNETLQSYKADKLHSFKAIYGGGERDRTDDPLLAKQVLSQLSYTPIRNLLRKFRRTVNRE